MKQLLSLVIFFSCFVSSAQQPAATDTTRRRDTSRRPPPAPVGTITPTRETPAHDPVMIKQKDKYYLFTTGNGIAVFSSKDMKNWIKDNPVFSQTPPWVKTALPAYRGSSMWAPDISFYNGKYYRANRNAQ